jgi:hypothetical protein
MGTPEQARIADTLKCKFRNLQTLVNEFTVEVCLYQSSIQVRDESSRMVFQALTHAAALSEQIEVALNMIREDLRIVDASSFDSATVHWREYLQDAFDEYSCAALLSTGKVH